MTETEEFISPRNMDLVVRSQTIPSDWSEAAKAESIALGTFLIGPNEGVAPKDLKWSSFINAYQMTNYEFGAYETYGDARCEAEDINDLRALFGTEFETQFYKRKKQLIAQRRLLEAYKERDALNEQIIALEEAARED